jgi:Spy/CpxP family protein refolding chaperone
MKRRTLILTIVAVVAIAAVPFAYAKGHHSHRDRGDGSMMFRHLARAKEALGLTDVQVEQLKGIAADLRAQNKPYRDQLRGGFANVAQALLNNPSDVAGAQALLDQQEQIERTMKSNTLAAAAKAIATLTPEQRTKVAQFLADRQARRNKN